MSAEHVEEMKQRFNAAYASMLGRYRANGESENLLDKMKSEFDVAMALLHDTEAEFKWVRTVLAEHGYSGPLSEASCPLSEASCPLSEASCPLSEASCPLSEASCPLREWLAPKKTQQVPATVTEYCVDIEDGGRNVFFDRAQAASKMSALVDRGEKFTFSTDEFLFSANWDAVCELISHGAALSPLQVHILKLGVAVGMTPEL